MTKSTMSQSFMPQPALSVSAVCDSNESVLSSTEAIPPCASQVLLSSKLDLGDITRFQQSVWQVVRTIPYGETRSYGWVADKLGLPKAARGVGQALARNPLPIVIPCHRVIGNNGSLGGFGGGVEVKEFLLRLERASSIKVPDKC